MTDPADHPLAWYLPVGYVLSEAHAEVLLRHVRPRVLAAGRVLAARLQAEFPERRVEGRAFVAEDLAGYVRGPQDRAIVLGVAWHEVRRRRVRAVVLALDWETGNVFEVEAG